MLRFSVASHWITATHFFLFERICSVFCAIWQSRTPFSQQVNGHAPFFRTIFSVFGDIERICSVFYAVFEPFSGSKVGGLNRSEWVDMLRFRHTYKFKSQCKIYDIAQHFVRLHLVRKCKLCMKHLCLIGAKMPGQTKHYV